MSPEKEVALMVEPGRVQLQMMMVQQSGPGALPLSILSPDLFLPFIREMERLTLTEKLTPVIVYWSRQSAARLLPRGKEFGVLLRESTCVTCFSEDSPEAPDEWCVLMESPGLSVVVYGQQAMESANAEKYQCVGSTDPAIVREAFNRLAPIWQTLDLAENNRLEDCRVSLGPGGSAPHLVAMVKTVWPVVKSPIQQNLLLSVEPNESSYYESSISGEYGLKNSQSQTGSNKIQPIAIDLPPAPSPIITGSVEPFTSGEFPIDSYVGGPLPSAADVPPPLPKGSTLELSGSFGAISVAGSQVYGDQSISAHIAAAEAAKAARYPVPSPEVVVPPPPTVPSAGSKRRTGNATRSGIRASRQDENLSTKGSIPLTAQMIISEIIGQLRHSSDLNAMLQSSIESLTKELGADRGLIWKINGDQLAVINEFSTEGNTCFVDSQLNNEESSAIVYEFLLRFPDDSGAGVISIPDTALDTDLHKMSRTLSSLLELGDVRGRVMVQLRSRGDFFGFLELQQCGKPREWTAEEAVVLQKVAEMLSVVMQQSLDQNRIEADAQEMKLINEIASLFRESKGESGRESLVKSVMLVADHMGFIHSQIYLFNHENEVLEPQILDNGSLTVNLSDRNNPFVTVFESARYKVVNEHYSRKGDPYFGHDMAFVLPLISEASRLGVIGLWQRHPKRPEFKPQDRELGLTIAGHLSNVIRADMAVQQIRADQAREALINKVSLEIKRSLKETGVIMDTLVRCLLDYFALDLCVVSHYEGDVPAANKAKFAGDTEEFPLVALTALDNGSDFVPPPSLAQQIADRIFEPSLPGLKEGLTLTVSAEDLKERLGAELWNEKWKKRTAVCVPLGQGNNFKAALLLVANEERGASFPEKDMRMVVDLADRVAVVVSHAELFATVERQAVTDAMTGLFNRRYFEEQLCKEIDRFQRFGHAFSFIIVDLDFLKKINDSKGHHVGDAAIIHIGNVIRKTVREIDTVGRFGGEEFVVLLPETDLKWAKMVAERICAAIREKPVEGCGIVTGSLGVATFPHDAEDKDRLFELADQALFLAKHRGRNQVCTVTEDLLPTLAEEGEEKIKAAMKQDMRMGPPVATPEKAVSDSVEFDVEVIKEKGILGLLAQLIHAVEERSAYTSDRSSRAYSYANRIAHALHLGREHSEVVSLAAVLCNLGKMAVPEEILKKPDPLTDEDLIYINQVPHTGAKFLEPAKVLAKIAGVVESYQEHWDGSGYPNGIKGDVIPIEARIVALVDAYTAITSDRPYRPAFTHEDAVKILQEGAGKEWDPRLVKIFLSMLNKEYKAVRAAVEAAPLPDLENSQLFG